MGQRDFKGLTEKLKNETRDEFFDKYIAYGNDKDLCNIEIQKLLIRYGYVEELVSLISGVIIDKEIIEKIMQSKLRNNKKLKFMNGKIASVRFEEDSTLPKDTKWLLIEFIDENNIKFNIKDIYLDNEIQDEENEMEKYEEIIKYRKNIIAIVERLKSELILKCFLEVS